MDHIPKLKSEANAYFKGYSQFLSEKRIRLDPELQKLELELRRTIEWMLEGQRSQVIDVSSRWSEEFKKKYSSLTSDGLGISSVVLNEQFLTLCGEMNFLEYDKSKFPTRPAEATKIVICQFSISEDSSHVVAFAFYYGVDPSELDTRHLDRWRGASQLVEGFKAGLITESDFLVTVKGSLLG